MAERVLICGDRNWGNNGSINVQQAKLFYDRYFQIVLDELSKVQQEKGVEVVIEGEAKGADTMGRLAAERLGIEVLKFPADWKQHGRPAGPIRNRQMLKEGKPTLVLAFHDFIENSKGTKDMVEVARKAGIPAKVIKGRN